MHKHQSQRQPTALDQPFANLKACRLAIKQEFALNTTNTLQGE